MTSPAAELAARYERLLAEHGPALARVAGSYAAARGRREDLFQDICLAIWHALPRFRGEASERTFIFRIAHNRGLSHSWRRRPAGEGLNAADALPDPLPGPEEQADARQRRRRLRAAVRRLPLAARQVVTLSLEGLSHREIGEVLGISENNVAVRLSRARTALRKLLEPVLGAHS